MRRPELAVLVAAASLLASAAVAQREERASPAEPTAEPQPLPADRDVAPASPSDAEPASRFSGMDEAVNVDLAEKAGAPVRKPYLDVESLGELWNLILLMGGAVCGFIVGRYWNQIWGRPK